jgi:hypothetical protein
VSPDFKAKRAQKDERLEYALVQPLMLVRRTPKYTSYEVISQQSLVHFFVCLFFFHTR